VVVRGDHRVNEIKLRLALGADFRPARPERSRAHRAARVHRPGRRRAAGPARRGGRRRRRRLRHRRQPPDAHLRGVEPGRDFAFERPTCARGRRGHRQRQPIRIEPAIEVGNIFKLGTRYSSRSAPRYLDETASAADLDGLLRDRAGAHRGGGGRAVRRRARHLLAAGDRAVRRAPRGARQAGQRGARARRRLYESSRELGWRCSTTTATRARARSSPTPSCSAARCG
jgi:hypothetical protein